MRVIFAGTPEFARVALERLSVAGHHISLVLTQPDRPGGRGMKVQTSAVKQFALDRKIDVCQPRSLRLDGKYAEDAALARRAIVEARADVMVVAAYGLILPQWVLDEMSTQAGTKGLGCINIHGSLLPRWRGAAPIHRAIEAGDTLTGVTIMQMDAGLDTGGILLMKSLPIEALDTTARLHDKVANLGADMIVDVLSQAKVNKLIAIPQPESGISYAHKIEKHEAAIDWRLPAAAIVRRVLAFNPFPGATVSLRGESIKVWSAQLGEGSAEVDSGTILALGPVGIAVAAMNSIAVLTELQRPGAKRLPAVEFLRGFDLQVGSRFDQTAGNPG